MHTRLAAAGVNSTPSSRADFLIVQRPGYHKDALGSARSRLDYLTASMAPVSRMQAHQSTPAGPQQSAELQSPISHPSLSPAASPDLRFTGLIQRLSVDNMPLFKLCVYLATVILRSQDQLGHGGHDH